MPTPLASLLRPLLLALCALLVLPASAAADLSLRYTQPAPDSHEGWERQALPIGNGRLGAMLFGQLAHERVQFNEITLWTGDASNMGAYQPFGDVRLHLAGHDELAGAVGGYQRALDISQAVQTLHYTLGGVHYQREAFASHPAQAIVLHLSADRQGSYSGSLQLDDLHGATITAQGTLLQVLGALPNGLRYASQLQVLHQGGQLRAEGQSLVFEHCDSLTLVLGAGTSYVADAARRFQGPAPLPRVAAQVAAAARQPYAKLRAEHVRDHQALFGRMALDLGQTAPERRALPTDERIAAYTRTGLDPELEALHVQYGRYLLIASSRDSLPANLQGLWNDNTNPPWSSDYHTNINLQMNYWPAEPANLSELAEPLLNFLRSQVPMYRQEVARRADLALHDPANLPHEGMPWDPSFKAPLERFLTADGRPVRGWTVRTESNPFGGMGFLWNKAGNAWYAQHFWEHYAYTQDLRYLREVAYPFMREVCDYWLDTLKPLPDGRLVAPQGWSPEHGPVEDGVSYDQQIIWDLFNNTAQAAAVLGDRADQATLTAVRDRLAGPRVGRWGQLLEWLDEKTDPVLDTPNDTHRHVSHLFALYPGHQITPLTTPALAAAARKTLQARGDAGTGWSMAWKMAFWARLQDGDHAHRMLRGLLAQPGSRAAQQAGPGSELMNGGGVYDNLLDAHPPFQIDGNFGATAAVLEMLLQSQDGQIQLLPALPAAWPSGRMRGLRARGGFEVDLAWQNGRLQRVTVRRVGGSGEGRLRYGDRQLAFQLQPGRSQSWSADLQALP